MVTHRECWGHKIVPVEFLGEFGSGSTTSVADVFKAAHKWLRSLDDGSFVNAAVFEYRPSDRDESQAPLLTLYMDYDA